MKVTIFVGIGANLNNPKAQVNSALVALSKLTKSRVIAHSSLYRTPPMGPQDQADYINAVAKLETRLLPIELLNELQAIEKSHGRVRKSEKWGPRTLDLDLLLYGNQMIKEERLTVPHYGIKQRAFVLVPLAEIEPELTLPDNSRIAELIKQTGNQGIQQL